MSAVYYHPKSRDEKPSLRTRARMRCCRPQVAALSINNWARCMSAPAARMRRMRIYRCDPRLYFESGLRFDPLRPSFPLPAPVKLAQPGDLCRSRRGNGTRIVPAWDDSVSARNARERASPRCSASRFSLNREIGRPRVTEALY